MVLSSLFLGLGIFLLTISQDASFAEKLLLSLVEGGTYWADHIQKLYRYIPSLPSYLDKSVLVAQLVFASLFAFILALLLFIMASEKNTRLLPSLTMILLIVHTVHIYQYKITEANSKTISLPREMLDITVFQSMPFHQRRKSEFLLHDSRDRILSKLKLTPAYWSTYAFLFKDDAGHTLRTDHWLKPFDQLMKAYWEQPLNPSEIPKGFLPYKSLTFPLNHPAARKMAAVSTDKIQFFTNPIFLSSEEDIAQLMRHPAYQGDILFLSDEHPFKKFGLPQAISPEGLSAHYRIDLKNDIDRFDANNLEIRIDVPGKEKVYLFYSDVWHPQWNATVNGQAVTIYKANLAYKAIPLTFGENVVRFHFESTKLTALYYFWGLVALGWLIGILYLTIGIIVPPSTRVSPSSDLR